MFSTKKTFYKPKIRKDFYAYDYYCYYSDSEFEVFLLLRKSAETVVRRNRSTVRKTFIFVGGRQVAHGL